MDVAREKAKSRRIRAARRSPVHSKTLGAPVRVDGERGCVRARLVDGVSGDVKGFNEWSDVPYVHFAGLGPACDVVWL